LRFCDSGLGRFFCLGEKCFSRRLGLGDGGNPSSGFEVEDVGIWGIGDLRSEFRVRRSEFRVKDLRFRAQDLGFRV